MPKPTPRDPTRPTVAYTTRNFYADLLDRLRVLAAVDDTTMEDELNYIVQAGLDVEEARRSTALGREMPPTPNAPGDAP